MDCLRWKTSAQSSFSCEKPWAEPSASAPEHILLSPRLAIPGTNRESAATELTVPAAGRRGMGPHGPINPFLQKEEERLQKTPSVPGTPAGMKESCQEFGPTIWEANVSLSKSAPGHRLSISKELECQRPALQYRAHICPSPPTPSAWCSAPPWDG